MSNRHLNKRQGSFKIAPVRSSPNRSNSGTKLGADKADVQKKKALGSLATRATVPDKEKQSGKGDYTAFYVDQERLKQQFADVQTTGCNLNTMRLRFMMLDEHCEYKISHLAIADLLVDFGLPRKKYAKKKYRFSDCVKEVMSTWENMEKILDQIDAVLLQFNKCDLNQDGLIEPLDLKEYLVNKHGAAKVTKKVMTEEFIKADANKDGGISFHEWTEYVTHVNIKASGIAHNDSAKELVESKFSFLLRAKTGKSSEFSELDFGIFDQAQRNFTAFRDDDHHITRSQFDEIIEKSGLDEFNPPPDGVRTRINFSTFCSCIYPTDDLVVAMNKMSDPNLNEIENFFSVLDVHGTGRLEADDILMQYGTYGPRMRRFIPRSLWMTLNDKKVLKIEFSLFCYHIYDYKKQLEKEALKEQQKVVVDGNEAQRKRMSMRLTQGQTVAYEMKLRAAQEAAVRLKRSQKRKSKRKVSGYEPTALRSSVSVPEVSTTDMGVQTEEDRSEEQLQSMELQMLGLNNRLTEADTRNQMLEQQLSDMASKLSSGKKVLQEQLDESIEANRTLQSKLTSVELENDGMASTCDLLKAELEKLNKEILDSQNQNSELKGHISSLETRLSDAERANLSAMAGSAETSELHQKVVELERLLEDERAAHSQTKEAYETDKTNFADSEKRLAMVDQEKQVLMAQVAQLSNDKMTLQSEKEELESKNAKMEADIGRLAQDKDHVINVNIELHADIAKLQEELRKSKEDHQEALDQMAQLQDTSDSRIQLLEDQIKSLEEQALEAARLADEALSKQMDENTRLKNEMAVLKEEARADKAECERLQAMNEELQDSNKDLKAEVRRLGQENTRLIDDMNESLRRERDENQRLQKEVLASSKLAKHGAENSKLKKDLASLSDTITGLKLDLDGQSRAMGVIKNVAGEILDIVSKALERPLTKPNTAEDRVIKIRDHLLEHGLSAPKPEPVVEEDPPNLRNGSSFPARLREALDRFALDPTNLNDLKIIFDELNNHKNNPEVLEEVFNMLKKCNITPEVAGRLRHVNGVSSVLSAMKQHLGDSILQDSGIQSLMQMVADKKLRTDFGTNNGVGQVVGVMKRHPDDPSLQQHAIKLITAASGDKRARRQIIDCSTIAQIIAAMRAPSTSSKVQHAGCWAIAKICTDPSTHQSYRDVDGATSVIAAAMKNHAEMSDVQYEACKALSTVSVMDPERTKIRDVGAVRSIITAMGAHEDHDGLQHCGCWAVATMCIDQPTRQLFALEGAITAVVETMKSHLTHAELQHQACRAIVNLSVDEDVAEQVAQAGAAEVIISCMSVHRDSSKILTVACWALSHLTVRDDIRLRVGNVDGVKVVLRAMQSHQKDEQLIKHGVWVLSHLSNSEKMALQMGTEGVDAIMDGMSGFVANMDLQVWGVRALNMLTTHDHLALHAQQHDAVGLLTNVMRLHANNNVVQTNGTHILLNLSKVK